MVDEYQDTSPDQVRLLEKLIGNRPYFIVGDPQQSIYLFRGSRSEVFHEKVDAVANEGGETKVKLVNYRSTPEVLSFINTYFTKLSSDFSAMEADPLKILSENKDPVVQIIQTSDDKKQSEDSELLTAMARVQELLKSGISPEKICILARTHKTLEGLARLAHSLRVPVQLHSQSQFYERREVMDALAILKFLVNPHDNINLVALLRSPWFVISDSEILKYCHSFEYSYWFEIQKSLNSGEIAQPVKRLNELLNLSEDRGISWALKEALIQFGLFDYSLSIDSSGRREANLWKIVALLSEQERRPGFNYLDFLDASLESLSVDEGGEDGDATPVIEPKRVNLMTVHASKGLQFDHVILPKMGEATKVRNLPIFCVHEKSGLWSLKIKDLESGQFNGSILAEQIKNEFSVREADEYLRVLYVALTRAKNGITLIWNENASKSSWAAKCPINLDPGLHEMKEFCYLVRNGNLMPEFQEKAEIVSRDVRPLWKTDMSNVNQRSLSVTDLVRPESERPSDIETKSLLPSLNRAQQGTNAHKIFEALKYTTYDDLVAVVEPNLIGAIDFILNNNQIPLREIIKNGYVEWGFAFKYKDYVVQGQIDLWGISGDTLWIIDYKTGSQKYSEVALKQLKSYAWALHQMKYVGESQKIALGIVYPLEQVIKVETVIEMSQLAQEMESKIDGLP
jgi:ATP-dependent helicase/nuclease subunit A